MSTPQNPSPNVDAILQSIQQEIQGLKSKLSLKDITVDLLTKQLKETQTKLEAMQRELEVTQTSLQAAQSELRVMKVEQGVIANVWYPNSVQSAGFDIRFKSSFNAPPIVQASISELNFGIPNEDYQAVRYRLFVDNITKEDAKIKLSTWYNNEFYSVVITWLAIGE